jgi:hypothetical protein
MSTYVCHDFKSPRADTSKRLPPLFMVVPVIFYLMFVGGSYVIVKSYMGYREALSLRDDAKARQADHEAEKAKSEEKMAEVTTEKWKAEKLAQWVEGTRALQPIGVAINRCMPPEITLAELDMERSIELPAQIILSVRINNGGVEEVAKIQNVVGNLSYRPYNSQQLKNGDSLEFKSMLVWVD